MPKGQGNGGGWPKRNRTLQRTLYQGRQVNEGKSDNEGKSGA